MSKTGVLFPTLSPQHCLRMLGFSGSCKEPGVLTAPCGMQLYGRTLLAMVTVEVVWGHFPQSS